MRLFTRRGLIGPSVIRRSPWRPEDAGASFTLDGEAVVCGPDGVAIFDAFTAVARCARRSYRPSIFWSSNGSDFRARAAR